MEFLVEEGKDGCGGGTLLHIFGWSKGQPHLLDDHTGQLSALVNMCYRHAPSCIL